MLANRYKVEVIITSFPKKFSTLNSTHVIHRSFTSTTKNSLYLFANRDCTLFTYFPARPFFVIEPRINGTINKANEFVNVSVKCRYTWIIFKLANTCCEFRIKNLSVFPIRRRNTRFSSIVINFCEF